MLRPRLMDNPFPPRPYIDCKQSFALSHLLLSPDVGLYSLVNIPYLNCDKTTTRIIIYLAYYWQQCQKPM